MDEWHRLLDHLLVRGLHDRRAGFPPTAERQRLEPYPNYPFFGTGFAFVFFVAEAFFSARAFVAACFATGFSRLDAAAFAATALLPARAVFAVCFAAGFSGIVAVAVVAGASPISMSKIAPRSSVASVGAWLFVPIGAVGIACSINSR